MTFSSPKAGPAFNTRLRFDSRHNHQLQTILQYRELNDDVRKASSVIFGVNTSRSADDDEDALSEISDEELERLEADAMSSENRLPADEPSKSLEKLLNEAYEEDELVQGIMAAKTRGLDKFHFALTNTFPEKAMSPGLSVIVIDENDEEEANEEWEVLEVVDCRNTRQYGLEYKATFKGNWDEWNSNPLWQPWTDFENASKKVLKFHGMHPGKPKPPQEFV